MITICIPTYNRVNFTINSFINILNDSRISEIVISDDFSDEDIFLELSDRIKSINSKKIKLFRNEVNIGSFLNKKKSVEQSSNDWVILLDSDNIIGSDYIDVIINKSDENTLYCPSHAICESPTLNYENYIGIFDIGGYKEKLSIGRSIWDCILNTGNFYFNKKSYLNCIYEEVNLESCYAADPYYLIYLWFKNIKNSKVEIVKDLKYIHKLHNSNEGERTSHYNLNAHNTNLFVDKIIFDVKSW